MYERVPGCSSVLAFAMLLPRGVDHVADRESGSRSAPEGVTQGVFRGVLPLLFSGLGRAVRVHEIDWLDKELFLAPPQGEKRQLDLVARLRLRPARRRPARS